MKIRTILLVSITALVLTTGYAAAENSQQDKMKNCNAVAKQRGLKGDERKDFMKTCLSAGSGDVAAKPNSQQERMKNCNKVAKAKNLKGTERETFMKDCLSGK